jgi:hypothetical protein
MGDCSKILEEIRKWLVQGSPNAKSLVDFPWEVEDVEENYIKAVYPEFPVDINIVCDENIGVIRVFTSTGFSTISLDSDERLKLYHKLLRMNAAPMAKFILSGDDDLVTIAVDLSIKTLGKQEFNDALALLLASLNTAVRSLGLQQQFAAEIYSTIIGLVKKHIEEGWGREKLIKYLVERVKMSREDAEKLIEELLGGEAETPGIYQ